MTDIVAVGGGKGGIGKSFLTANVGALLAAVGKRTLILDLDLGSANVHTFFGIPSPKKGLQDFFDHTVPRLEEAAVPSGVARLDLVTSKGCGSHVANLHSGWKSRLISAIRKLPHDVVLIDLGAGTHFNTLDFFLAADQGLVITTPEPTAIENAFRFIHALCFRRLSKAVGHKELKQLVADCKQQRAESSVRPKDILQLLSERDPETGQAVEAAVSDLVFHLVTNQVRNAPEREVGRNLASFYNRFFHDGFHVAGNISHDGLVRDAIVRQSLFVFRNKQHKVTREIMAVVRAVLVDLGPELPAP